MARRLFDDPRNTYIVGNDDPAAFDKRFVGRPGVHREQQCCGNREPVWQPYLLHDDQDPDDDNPRAYQYSVGMQVEDATGASDNVHGGHAIKGYCWVEGPASGYRPAFISPAEWMRWQGVQWIPSPNPEYQQAQWNPERWVRTTLDAKLRWAHGSWELLWCQKCETGLESAWSDVLEALPAIARGIAMVASWVPVWGTALSMVITASVALAEGESLDDAGLEAIGTALPGQPTSGMVFSTAVAIGRGERAERGLIQGLHLGETLTGVILIADDVLYGIAQGDRLDDLAYQTVRDRLPADAQAAMDLARRVARGESLPEMVLVEAEQEALDRVTRAARTVVDEARSRGEEALRTAQTLADSFVNQYAIECGYQIATDGLPREVQDALRIGLIGGAATRPPDPPLGVFLPVAETNVAANDALRVQGEAILAAGVKYRNSSVSEMLAAPTFPIVIDEFDCLNEVMVKRPKNYRVTPEFRRGFAIAMAVCAGSSIRGPGQTAVYHTLAEVGGRDGFLAGQAVQFDRTLHGETGFTDVEVTKTTKTVRGGTPDFVGLSPAAATALAKDRLVTVEFEHAQSQDDVFGEDLQALREGDGGELRPHTDAEIVVTVQVPKAETELSLDATVKLGVALAPGVQ